MTPSTVKGSLRKLVPVAIALAVVGGFAWSLMFLYEKSQEKPVVYETEQPFETDIVKKTVATGAIVPRKEVELKPRVSGVITEIAVEPGKEIEKGDFIARIQIVPDMVALNRAESQLQAARISLDNAKAELARHKKLYEQNVISQSELAQFQLDAKLKEQDFRAAASNVQLLKEGAARGSGKVSNEVTSTVNGMVLEIPVEEGMSVIESNTFNEGTTIAFVADMGDMIFEGRVDESEVGKIEEGMDLEIKIGALDDQRFEGTLEYISPKGVELEGAIQFEIRARMDRKEGVFIRANYSANADIVLDRRTGVLAIRESLLQFDDDGSPYVEVEVGEQQFERRDVKVGLSDGINVEILEGVSKNDRIKRPPDTAGKPGRRRR